MNSADLTLTYAEANILRDSNYPCPPGYSCPPGWELSTGGVPVSPSPQGQARRAAITQCYYAEFSREQRMDLRWDPDNTATWDTFFVGRRERELARYGGDGPPPESNNEAGRRLWWTGRTLAGVVRYILAGDHPRLRYPRSQETNSGDSESSTAATRGPLPPTNHLRLMHLRASSRAHLEYDVPAYLPRGASGCVCHDNTNRTSTCHGCLSPSSQPIRPQPELPRHFQPRPASDASDDSGEYDDYEYMYCLPRQEYD